MAVAPPVAQIISNGTCELHEKRFAGNPCVATSTIILHDKFYKRPRPNSGCILRRRLSFRGRAKDGNQIAVLLSSQEYAALLAFLKLASDPERLLENRARIREMRKNKKLTSLAEGFGEEDED